MRYKLQIRSSQNSRRIFLPLFSNYPRCFGQLEGVIDTRSPRTVLSVADACRLHIPFKSLPQTELIRGYGKGGCPTLKIDKFLVTIKSEDNNPKSLEFPISIVDFPALNKLDENMRNRAFTMPTLLGLDFLEFNNLSLFINIKNGDAFLEDIK